MKFLFFFVAFLCFILCLSAAPNDAGNQENTVEEAPVPPIQPRATCDLIGGIWGDRACAAHCIGLGYRGGYCNSQKVCVCRN